MRHLQLGLGREQADLRIFVVLLADGVNFYQRRITRGRGLRRLERGAGLACCRLRLGQRGLVRRRVDLVQGLPGLDLSALDKQPLLDNSAHLRANVSQHKGLGTPGQFGGQRLALRLHRHHLDFRGLRNGRGIVSRAAAQGKKNQHGNHHRGGYQRFSKKFGRHSGLCKWGGLSHAPSCEANVQEI